LKDILFVTFVDTFYTLLRYSMKAKFLYVHCGEYTVEHSIPNRNWNSI